VLGLHCVLVPERVDLQLVVLRVHVLGVVRAVRRLHPGGEQCLLRELV